MNTLANMKGGKVKEKICLAEKKETLDNHNNNDNASDKHLEDEKNEIPLLNSKGCFPYFQIKHRHSTGVGGRKEKIDIDIAIKREHDSLVVSVACHMKFQSDANLFMFNYVTLMFLATIERESNLFFYFFP